MTDQPSASSDGPALGPVGHRIETKLKEAFRPDSLDVIDESELHRGHAGYRPEGETHFRVRITSAAFAGQARLARQRAIHKTLSDELAERVHALTIEAKAPGE